MKKPLTAAILALSFFSTAAFADYTCYVSNSHNTYSGHGHTYYEACQHAMETCVHNTSHHDSCHVNSH